MKHTTILVSAALLAALGPALRVHALPIRPQPTSLFESSNGLTVHGHSEITVRPNIAYATLGVITQSQDQQDATTANAARVKSVLAVLESSGIAVKDIQTQYYTIQPQYDYKPTPPVLTGYQVTNSIRVTIRDLTKAGLVLDKATRAGATEVSGITFDLGDRSKAEGTALVAAVANARTKADLIAGAAGVDLGKVISISDNAAIPVQPIIMGAMRAMSSDADNSTPIVPQEIRVTADVTMSYAISSPH